MHLDSKDTISLTRDPSKLANQEYDLLVIGGGINGAGVAWEAALRGLKVVLVEKADFGEATSAACFKIIHGGLRYLQHLDFSRIFESINEQRILRKIAAEHLSPLPFIVPCYGYGMRGKQILQFALSVYEILSWRKNKEVLPDLALPHFKVLSRDECLKIAPGLNQRGLKGGVVYYDCQIASCERLTLSVIKAATAAGANCYNYLKAVKFNLNDHAKIKSVEVEDQLNGKQYQVNCKYVVNATGPWSEKVSNLLIGRDTNPERAKSLYSKGIQLIVPQMINTYAVAIETKFQDQTTRITKGGRSYFIVPWKGYTLLGTTDTVYQGDPDQFQIDEFEIRQFLSEIKLAYPSPILSESNVLHAFGGLRLLSKTHAKLSYQELNQLDGVGKVATEDKIVNHGELGFGRAVSNLVSVVGVKYTTFRLLAEKVLKELIKLGLKTQVKSQTQHTLLPVSKITNNSEINEKIIFAIRNEMACKLSDVVCRRTEIGAFGYPGEEQLFEVARVMAAELNWDRARIKAEVLQTQSAFPVRPQDNKFEGVG